MGFVTLVSPMRDMTSWKKILDYGINSNLVTAFAADAVGRIVLFDDGLIHMTKLPARSLSRMPVRDLREHLFLKGSGRPPEEEGPEDLFRKTDFRGQGGQGTLVWWGFQLGVMPPPAGIYFLASYDRMPTEKQMETIEYPTIVQMKDKIQNAVAHHLLEESDQRVLLEEVPRLMEWEAEGFKTNRVFLVDGVTLDDGPRPIYLQFDGPEDNLRMIQENVSIGDIQFFRKMSEAGARPALVEHTEKTYRYEIMLPLTWYIHVMGWIGIPFPSLDLWMKPVRLNFEEIVRNMGDALGEERMALGLLPKYDVHRGLFEEESFLILMEGMIARHPPRPFVVLLVQAPPASRDFLQGILDRSKRPSDILAQVGEDLVLLFPDQDVSRARGIEDRYREVLEKLLGTKPDLNVTISVFWFPSTAWTSRDLMATLLARPKIPIMPKTGSGATQKNFDEWFKRFLVLKDWE